MRNVLQTLRKKWLYVKFTKCEFWFESVAFLGLIVSKNGVMVDSTKIKVVRSWASHTSPTEVRSLFWLEGY